MNRADGNKVPADASVADHSPVPSEWQFSLRGLLISTTIVSACLALGTYLAGIAFAVFVLVLLQVLLLLSIDWLIRPANRRLLAFVTGGTWMLTGSGLLAIAAKLMLSVPAANTVSSDVNPEVLWSLGLVLAPAAVFCYWFGWRRWRRLSAQRRAKL
jgi:hypothetical protein